MGAEDDVAIVPTSRFLDQRGDERLPDALATMVRPHVHPLDLDRVRAVRTERHAASRFIAVPRQKEAAGWRAVDTRKRREFGLQICEGRRGSGLGFLCESPVGEFPDKVADSRNVFGRGDLRDAQHSLKAPSDRGASHTPS
jgi:hypothetical protein